MTPYAILKDKPDLMYYYRCVKEDSTTPCGMREGHIFLSSKKIDDNEHYKLAATFRQSFIGDMQQRTDEALKTDNMRNFAESCGENIKVYVPVYKEVFIRETIFAYLIRVIKKKVKVCRCYIKNWRSNRFYSRLFKVDKKSNAENDNFLDELFNL